MSLADLISSPGQWLCAGDNPHDIVISSRARLARNLAGMPFLGRCDPQQAQAIETRLRDDIMQLDMATGAFYVPLADTSEIDRVFLLERHLISQQHAEATGPHGVMITPSEDIAIMVNEEDHLRLQVLRGGADLKSAVNEAIRLDTELEKKMDFAFHKRYGYLTACPTNIGTGLRVSVMLHLPALKMSGEIEKVFRAARDMHVAIRGLYGEGTEATGDFFQISNQTTLGKSEMEIVDDFGNQVLPHIIEYERQARESLMIEERAGIEDKVFRAQAILKSARLISSGETMQFLSMVRLGVHVGIIDDIDITTVNELFLVTQPAHLQKINDQDMPPRKRAQRRADYIRKRLGA